MSVRKIIPWPWVEVDRPSLPFGMSGRCFQHTQRGFSVLVTNDTDHPLWPGWHMSISHPRRYPTWDEIRDARYALLADEMYMAQILPPRGEYVSIHPNCFHLHEIKRAMEPTP